MIARNLVMGMGEVAWRMLIDCAKGDGNTRGVGPKFCGRKRIPYGGMGIKKFAQKQEEQPEGCRRSFPY